MSPEQVFSIASAIALLSWLLLAVLPRCRWVTEVVTSKVLPGLFAVLYLGIIVSMFGGTAGGFSSLAGVSALFANPWLLLAGWFGDQRFVSVPCEMRLASAGRGLPGESIGLPMTLGRLLEARVSQSRPLWKRFRLDGDRERPLLRRPVRFELSPGPGRWLDLPRVRYARRIRSRRNRDHLLEHRIGHCPPRVQVAGWGSTLIRKCLIDIRDNMRKQLSETYRKSR